MSSECYIYETKGDLLDSSAKIRCQQVNCQGVMGAGLAKQVKERYPEVFEQYKALCDQFGSSLMGHTQFVSCHDGTIMANLFAQETYGTSTVQTDIGALDDCLSKVADFSFRVGAIPAFPKFLGCGLAGGDWDAVYKLISGYFNFKGAGCMIVEKEQAQSEPQETSATMQEELTKDDLSAKKLTDVTIYTDGSCRFNPGPGGWGAILITNLKKGPVEKRISGGKQDSTNNEMELTAVKEALSLLKHPCRVTLYSDSSYVINSINKGWMAGWKKNGWKKKGGVANLELWQEVDKLLQLHDVTCIWVKGHASNEYNNLCDEMAQAESAKFLQEGRA